MNVKQTITAILFSGCVFLISACGGGGDSKPAIDTPDTTDPVITLLGLATVDLVQGNNYVEQGATANDNVDGNISANIVIAGDNVNPNAPLGSTFVITYNVNDAAGNAAIEVTRTVSIVAAPNNRIPTLSAATIKNYLDAINSVRTVARKCGTKLYAAAPPLKWNDKLYKAAYEHSQDMSSTNITGHGGSGTASDWTGYPLGRPSLWVERVNAYGYGEFTSTIYENVSVGPLKETAENAVASWLPSPGHCRAIMDPNVIDVGLAISTNKDATYWHYWTLITAAP